MLQLDPALPTILKRGIRRGLLILKRERSWGASLGSLLGVFVMLQLLLLGLIGIGAVQSLLTSNADMRLEIRSDASRAETQQFLSDLQQLPYVAHAVYITREQAFAQAEKEEPSLVEFLQKFGIDNPYTDTIGVTLASLDDYPLLTTYISQPRWQRIVDPAYLSTISHQEERMHELIRVAAGGKNLTFLLILLAGAILLSTIVELTRRNALSRSEEVLVERLVGASTLAIFLPFAAEATILLWVSMAVSSVVLLAFIFFLPSLVPALGDGGALASLRSAAGPLLTSILPTSLLLEVLLAVPLAALGSWLGIRTHIRSTSLSIERH
jgi:cell division protein FtsX